MRGKRERIFDVEYGTEAGTSRSAVRAWTPVEAAQTFEEALARVGVLQAGQICVRDRSGHVLLHLSVPVRPDAGVSGAA